MNTILYQQLVSGSLMIIVAVAGVVWWKLWSRVPWRWFWAGAAIWTVGVALKFAVAKVLNPMVLGTGLPPRAGLGIGVLYCGLMTGIFEIGITLAAALIWRRLAADPMRAVAVGLGAGAFEALLLGLAAAGGCLIAAASGQGDQLVSVLKVYVAHTPLFFLAGPVERILAIAAHTAGRVLVLQAVARHAWLGFWAGFGWLSLIDALAGIALLTGLTTSDSIWWSELLFLPVGLLSIPITRAAMGRWPQPEPAPVESLVEETVQS